MGQSAGAHDIFSQFLFVLAREIQRKFNIAKPSIKSLIIDSHSRR